MADASEAEYHFSGGMQPDRLSTAQHNVARLGPMEQKRNMAITLSKFEAELNGFSPASTMCLPCCGGNMRWRALGLELSRVQAST